MYADDPRWGDVKRKAEEMEKEKETVGMVGVNSSVCLCPETVWIGSLIKLDD